ncbi:MAG: FAD-binding protein [Candidatus Thermoplasmatota archaeon]|nr:FAD-binding protein [Candidatus Thermoplasmatota archaeon]
MAEAYKTNECDVLIIGAGGAGMRAALAASDAGLKVIVVTKSLLGKAHTVMAEGGIAASLGNVDPEDNWTVHFADVIEEGVYISNWRMAELVAREAPNRVYELEKFGALFDRTPDGRILQRAFGGHTYRRLCHVGDRTGLEIIRTLQDQIIHRKNVNVIDEMYITKLLLAEGRVCGAIGIKMDRGEFNLFKARSVVMATGGCGRVFKVTSNSWESTGDGIGLAYNVGAVLQDMEMIQFHPTGMVYPPGVKGLLVTEGVRGEGGILYNNQKERYMERYSPKKKELDARDVVARANYAEIQAGRGTEHGGVYLDISYKGADFVKQKLPSMYHQFMEFAGIDITKEMMEVAPTVHYQMGGIKVEPDTGATNVPGLFAAGEVACGLHGANRLGGNSLADILVFGKIVGEGATKFATTQNLPTIEDEDVVSEIERVKSLVHPDGLNAYKLIDELTTTMSDNVGIVRDQEHLEIALKKILELKEKYQRVSAPGGLKYNHGLLAALELGNMLVATEAIVRSAIMRPESRGAHTRRDYPKKNPEWLKNITCVKDGDNMKFDTVPVPEIPEELKKYVKPEVY